MATKSRKKKSSKFKYFFINEQLHKAVFISRPHDLVFCWNYPEHKKMSYSWQYILHNHKRAWKTTEVAKMVNRDRRSISNYFMQKDIQKPQVAYGLTEIQREHQYFWREEDVMALHDYLLTVAIGRPRKDGGFTIKPMPTRMELLAMMRQDTIVYVKTEEGFVPAWREPGW